MTDEDPHALVARADELDERINAAGLHEQIAHLTDYGRRNRKLIRLNQVLTGAVLMLCLIAWLQQSRVNENRRIAGQAKAVAEASVVANALTCDAANDSRAGQRQLWAYILSFTAPGNPEQQQRLAQLQALVATTFAPRDCAREAPTTGEPPTSAPSRSP